MATEQKMSRKALVVGINSYSNFEPLHHAEPDAAAIARRLNYHGDESAALNFDVRLLLNRNQPVARAMLREAIKELFDNCAGLDLAFYFAGHGFVSETSGWLVTSDGERNDYGITMEELTTAARLAPARSVLLMLDCCHAGAVGNFPPGAGADQQALLDENMTILAASLPMQLAVESTEGGLFTAALKDALDGAAADFLGNITVASVYSVVERRFSLWQQQPVAKSYVTRPTILRKVKPRLSLQELRRIIELFPAADNRYRMEPDHDPERDVDGVARTPEVPEKIEIGRLFKRYRDAALLCASVPGEDLYYVAQRRHEVELTLFGREYWRLVTRRGV